MKIFHLCFTISIIFLLLLDGSAQENREPASAPPNKDQIELETKAFDLLSEVAAESATLKLAENRAFMFALIGGLLWEKDEKNARRLFYNAAADLVEAQNNPKKRNQFDGCESEDSYWSRYVHRVLRGQTVYSVMSKDAPQALEILNATRPAKLRDALDFYAQAAQSGDAPDPSKFKSGEASKLDDAVAEMQLEQRIKKEIIKNDPQKLADTIRENFFKGFDIHELLNDLENLNKKDHDAAQKILGEMVQKLADSNFKKYHRGYLAYLFYNRFTPKADKQNSKDKRLEIDEKSIKAAAALEFDDLLAQTPAENDFHFVERVLYIRLVLPERFKEIQAKYERAKGSQAREWAEDSEATEQLGDNPTLPQIVENSSKLSTNSRTEYYKKVVAKLAETENREKVTPLLEKIPDEKDRKNAFDFLRAVYAEKNAGAENATEAKKAALEIKSDKEKLSKLISLAMLYHRKGGEKNTEIAEDLMNEAGKFVNQTPATRTEHEKFLPFVAAYAAIRPAQAFDLLAPVIGKSNDLIDAFVLIGSYNDMEYPYYSENEIVFVAQDGYSSYSHKYRAIAKTLATKDFDAAKTLIKLFRREDVRLMAKLMLIESVLAK